MLGWDIETGPEEEKILKKRYKPFDPASVKHPGEFDPNTVAYGNTKDETKRAQKLEECRAKHADLVANHGRNVEQAAANHWKEFVAKAALSPVTGRLLAVGGIVGEGDGTILHLAEHNNERELLSESWDLLKYHRSATKAGWNIFGFDLPFLILRSAILEVSIPNWIRDKKLFFDATFMDLMKVWTFPMLHNPLGDNKLDTVCSAFGLGCKPEGIDGGDFATLYWGGDENRAKALSYLKNDLQMTWNVANFLQVL